MLDQDRHEVFSISCPKCKKSTAYKEINETTFTPQSGDIIQVETYAWCTACNYAVKTSETIE